MAAFVFILQVDLAIPVDALFDDLWIWSPRFAAASCTSTMHVWLDLMGLVRKPSKYISPLPCLEIAGLNFEMKFKPPRVVICNTLTRVDRYCSEIALARSSDSLSHGQAQKLGQKLTFAGRGI